MRLHPSTLPSNDPKPKPAGPVSDGPKKPLQMPDDGGKNG